jgi:arylsulfatase A-like enzyme
MLGTGLRRHLLAGLLLCYAEVGLVLATRRALFASQIDLMRYATLAATALPAACVILGLLAHAVLARLGTGRDASQRVPWLVFALALPSSAWAMWALTAGRRVHALAGRALWVALAALAAAALLALIATALMRATTSAARFWAGALFALAAVSVVFDALVLPRLYPAFHLALFVLCLCSALCGAAVLPLPSPRPSRERMWWPVSALAVLAAVLGLRLVAAAPGARSAIEQAAPLTGRLLRWARATTRRPEPQRSGRAMSRALELDQRPGIDLRGRDVLLITIDALRADRLRAYGGHGLTPALDALADESVVFLRAYTPTPHTSYALGSLMTGKYLVPLLSLSENALEHSTLARLLRAHGYRTAAFYPPAVFSVDRERFTSMERDQLGFEYVKAMYSSAAQRVSELEQYLREVEPGHPVLAWVHLFEPHEPYEPLPEFARGNAPVQRYDAEVAAADAGVAKLVAAFRKARPGATVIVTADHGEEFGEHGGSHHGTTLFDEQVRVPLLWSSPGQARPRQLSAPVDLVGLPVTLLSSLGIAPEGRMRGVDLGPLLAGGSPRPGMRAFAFIEGMRMVTDGSMKLICGDADCQLFDLVRDPAERRDESEQQPAVMAALRDDLDALVASVPRAEALGMRGGGAWPEALVRARLGDVRAAPELAPLLSAARPELRAAAARAAGELDARSLRSTLEHLRDADSDSQVSAEAAIASLLLGDVAARGHVAALLSASPGSAAELVQRAALALAGESDRAGEGVLLALASDLGQDASRRVAAVRALAKLGGVTVSRGLVPLLDDLELRAEAADALGRIGDREATAALVRALGSERYPLARRAEARALLALGARREALASIRRFLGTESSLPDGVGLLLEAGALASPSAEGADLRTAPSVRRGPWQCEARGCRPLPRASIALIGRHAGAAPVRVVLRVMVEGGERGLRVAAEPHTLTDGTSELTFLLARVPEAGLAVDADQGVWLEAMAVVPQSADVPASTPAALVPSGAGQ